MNPESHKSIFQTVMNLKKENLTDRSFSNFMGATDDSAMMYNFSQPNNGIISIIERKLLDQPISKEDAILDKYMKVIFPSSSTVKKYTRDEVRNLFRLHFIEKLKPSLAVLETDINSSTGQQYIRDAIRLVDCPAKEKGRGNQKLFRVHDQRLSFLFEENPLETVENAVKLIYNTADTTASLMFS